MYELKKCDKKEEPFSEKCLVVIPGNTKLVSSKTINEMRKLSLQLRSNLKQVIIIPRCKYGQYYICRGLQQSLHFSLGKKGVTLMIGLMNTIGVKVSTYNASLWDDKDKRIEELFNNTGVFLHNMRESSNSPIDIGLINYMTKMGKEVWSTLFFVSVV